MAKKKPDAPTESIELYDRLIETLPNQKRKGAASAYTSHNGHMFSFVDKTGEFAFRFSDKRKSELIDELGGKESIQYGSVMRGYVVIPESLMDNFDTLAKLIAESYEYIASLPPKPTKKKSPKKK